MKTSLFTAPILILTLAACGGADSPAADTMPVVPSNPDNATPTAAADTFDNSRVTAHAALIALESLKQLHEPRFINASTYQKHGFHMGLFRDESSWNTFSSTAKLEGAPSVDWNSQVVAYVVFDGQTNSLDVAGVRDEDGALVLGIKWDPIEPYYEAATPAAFAVIEPGKAQELRFDLTGGQAVNGSATLGSISF